MTFGIEPFKIKNTSALPSKDAQISPDGERESEAEVTATAKNVLKFLADFLDSEVG